MENLGVFCGRQAVSWQVGCLQHRARSLPQQKAVELEDSTSHHRAADCTQSPTRFNFRELQPAVAWTSPKMSGFLNEETENWKFCRTNPHSLNFSGSGREGAGLAERGSTLLRAHCDWAVDSIAWPHHLRIPFFLISLFLSPSAWQGKRWHTEHAAVVSTLEGKCRTCSS